MNLRKEKLVQDLRLYGVANVSKERGRKRLVELEQAGEIAPLRTPTGRTLLSFEEAERLAGAL